MKMRSDHVTNSSTTAFIILSGRFEKIIEEEEIKTVLTGGYDTMGVKLYESINYDKIEVSTYDSFTMFRVCSEVPMHISVNDMIAGVRTILEKYPVEDVEAYVDAERDG